MLFIHVSARSNDGTIQVLMYFIQISLLLGGSVASWLAWLNILALSPTNAGQSSSGCILPLTDYENMVADVFISLFFFVIHSINMSIHAVGSKIVLPALQSTRLLLLKDLGERVFGDFKVSAYVRSTVALLL